MSDFLGAGMKFPPQIDMNTGRFAVSAGAASVKESVYIILMTHLGERWLEPSFGSQLTNYVFMDASPTMINILTQEIQDVISEQEPRIAGVDVNVDPTPKDGCLIVNIGYRLAGGYTPDSMVFPFYIGGLSEGYGDD
ncbi:MAG: GPW/gp25 family protein [Oscillospiraceae bacterium]|nr:GPW/gp25 family protein [Oscillospiraceae bacterium]